MTEFGLIESIAQLFDSIPRNGIDGIGDDCATIPMGGEESLVITSDMLIEDVHFLRGAISPSSLGAKSLSVNLSDIAAMGARPAATLLSISIPEQLMGSWIEEFMQGYHALSSLHSVALIGGDTTASRGGVAINVTAIGIAKNKNIKKRSTARAGDLILVSGELGGSGAGLKDILNGNYNTPLAKLHNSPTARIEEGVWLGARDEVHAMMDISDGVASDITHILNRSKVGAEIELRAIPAATDIKTALSAGEDYELLFTAEASKVEDLCRDYTIKFKKPLYIIGKIIDSQELIWLEDGQKLDINFNGFRHF
ncbi:MAG: thiamine-phosphate kinase [Rikenellaceae bacterium]